MPLRSCHLGQRHRLAFHREQLADSHLAIRDRDRDVVVPEVRDDAGLLVGWTGEHLDVRAQIDLVAHGDLGATQWVRRRAEFQRANEGRDLARRAAPGDKTSGRRAFELLEIGPRPLVLFLEPIAPVGQLLNQLLERQDARLVAFRVERESCLVGRNAHGPLLHDGAGVDPFRDQVPAHAVGGFPVHQRP
jgi:hypothetical protein